MMMKLSEQQKRIKKAKQEFSDYLFEWSDKNNLSFAEIMMILSGESQFLANGAVKDENE